MSDVVESMGGRCLRCGKPGAAGTTHACISQEWTTTPGYTAMDEAEAEEHGTLSHAYGPEDAQGWREGVRQRAAVLEQAGASRSQAYVQALEERLSDEYAENRRLWQPEASLG